MFTAWFGKIGFLYLKFLQTHSRLWTQHNEHNTIFPLKIGASFISLGLLYILSVSIFFINWIVLVTNIYYLYFILLGWLGYNRFPWICHWAPSGRWTGQYWRDASVCIPGKKMDKSNCAKYLGVWNESKCLFTLLNVCKMCNKWLSQILPAWVLHHLCLRFS